MTRKYFFYCFPVVLILFISANFLSRKQQLVSSFSPVASNSTNLIDIGNLNRTDYEQVFEGKYNGVYVIKDDFQKQVYFNDKPLQSLELSPSLDKVAFFYRLNNSSSKALSLTLLNLDDGETREIFHTDFPSWDVTSSLHWLGNDHLFFLRHCGTSCQGITLLNIKSGETQQATLSYSSFPDQPAITRYKDWFGQEHTMVGFVREVKSQTKNDRHYLAFILEDNAGNYLEEKTFPLFDFKTSSSSLSST
ncbi:MAG: hypothetical protein ABIJ03_04005 [Patescibacteria group bacterium]|nr:hypothetical protein [Patescibacteria group bacterium]